MSNIETKDKIDKNLKKLKEGTEKIKGITSNLKEDSAKVFKEKKEGMVKRALKPFEDLTSLPTATWNKIFKRYRFSDFLPYLSYDEKNEIYVNNDNTYGCVFRISPRIKMGDSTSEVIEEVLNKLPDDVFLQFMIIGSKNQKDFLELWRNEHLNRGIGSNDELLVNAINSMADFYYSKTKESLSRSMITMSKNFVVLVSIKGADKKKILNLKRDAENIFKSNGFGGDVLSPKELKPYLYEIFNPNHDLNNIPYYDENCYLSRQVIAPSTSILVKDTHIEVDNKCWISLALQGLPKEFHISYFGEKIGDTISASLDTNQFTDAFIITASICALPKGKTTSTSRNHSVIATQNWSETIFREFAAVRRESVDIIERIDNQKQKLYAFDLNILLSGEDFEKAKENSQRIISYWSKGGDTGIVLDEALGIHQLNFIASLPMGINEEYIFNMTGKYRSLFAEQISQFIPVEADYNGNYPNLVLYSRRGQIAGLDLFVSNINYNGYLVATSGAGKSVLLNMIAFNSYARGDRVFILDYDNSFLKLCETLGGQYLALDPNKPISFNPFSDIDSKEKLMEEMDYFSSLVYMLGSSKYEAKSLEEEKLIKSKIQEIIGLLYDDIGNELEITHIRDRLKTIKDQRFDDFASQLRPFCKEGIYGEFFTGKNQFNISREFIVAEFKAIDNSPDLRDPLIMLIIYHLNQLMYVSDKRANRMQIILDEAHRFLGKNPKMDDFIEQGYRRFRKYNASAILATQGFDDIYNMKTGGLSRAGSVIVNNSSWKIFMKQTEVSINMLLNSKLFNFSMGEERLLKSITTKKGEYSELLLITPEEFKVPYRLIMDRFFYYVTTTDPKDKDKIKKLTDSGIALGEAIKQLVEEDKKNGL